MGGVNEHYHLLMVVTPSILLSRVVFFRPFQLEHRVVTANISMRHAGKLVGIQKSVLSFHLKLTARSSPRQSFFPGRPTKAAAGASMFRNRYFSSFALVLYACFSLSESF